MKLQPNIIGIKISVLFSLLWAMLASSCSEEIPVVDSRKGEGAVAEITIGAMEMTQTRAGKDSYDQWSVSTFGSGDEVGLFARGGLQNPEDPDDYNSPIENGRMFFESANGSKYRFSNGDIILNPTIVHDNYSIMYYPYYADMPSAEDKSALPGMPLRIMDEDGIEKCVDFMQTTYEYSTTGYYAPKHYLTLSSGVLSPTFYHYMSELVIQRGEGFENASDKRVWVILKNPFTDIRVKRSSSYAYEYQNLLDTGEDVVLIENYPKLTPVNKNRVWQAWQGNPYNAKLSYYVIIPPREVSYILIQDNYGNWQNVFDFYLYETGDVTNKTPKSNNRYIVNVKMEGLKAVVRPVAILDWSNGGEITDQWDCGINSNSEYVEWVRTYNSYIQGNKENLELEKKLTAYGKAVKDEETGRTDWTFFISHDIDYRQCEGAYINKLDDTLMGASVYTNYTLSNLAAPLIGEMTEYAAIKSLDFNNIYIVDLEGENSYTGGLAREMAGGVIHNCNLVNGVIVSNKPAGMAIGKIEGGKISACSFSGEVIGSQTSDSYPGLFGTDPFYSIDLTGTSYRGVYFEAYN